MANKKRLKTKEEKAAQRARTEENKRKSRESHLRRHPNDKSVDGGR